MTRVERTALVAAGCLLAVGGGLWALASARRRDLPPVPDDGTALPGRADEAAPGAARGSREGTGPAADAGRPDGAPAAPRGGTGLPTALRTPEGIDLSDPAVVRGLLREHLAAPDGRWDAIAQLLGVLSGPLDADLKGALQEALVRGNAPGALQAYARLRDGTVVPDLLRLLDDAEGDARVRANVLRALGAIPGADEAVLVRGIEERLDGDPAHDAPYLEAIARRGGAEGTRALVDALSKAPDPARYPPETFRDLDLRRSPGSSEVLAEALADPDRSPAALRAVAELAGRPGASPAVVEALAALDADGRDPDLRAQALRSLAGTGDDRAIARVLERAAKGDDPASAAARGALAEIDAASPGARARLLDAARDATDEDLRTRVVTALGAVREKKAVPMLADWVAKGGEPLRRESVIALGRMGADANPAIEAMAASFGTGDDGFRCLVADALSGIGTQEAKRMLDQLAVAEKDPRVQKAIRISQDRLEARLKQ